MSTTGTPYPSSSLPYQPYQAPTAVNPIGFSSPTDARKLAQNQRAVTQGQGDALMANDQALANQYAQQATGTQSYLQPIENTLAQGGGGYNQNESSQIMLSPQDKQNIITGAGVSAGAGQAANIGAAERAAAATGGNPEALATYRARAEQTQGAQAGDAMTKARIEAQQAGSQGAQTVGNARLAQEGQALGYYGGLQGQQNANALQEQALQQGAYGTETAGTGQAAGLGLQASQTPSMFDKITGALATGVGAATGGAATLADGTTGYLSDGIDAVLGEDGPEVIVNAASDPVRSHTKFMANGSSTPDDPADWAPQTPKPPMPPTAAAPGNPASFPPWLQQYLSTIQKPGTGQAQQPQQWNKTIAPTQMGSMLGTFAAPYLKQWLGPKTAPSGTPNSAAPMTGPSPYSGSQLDASAMPGGTPGGRSLENRTGETIDGVPSLPSGPGVSQVPTFGDATAAGDITSGLYADGTALYADGGGVESGDDSTGYLSDVANTESTQHSFMADGFPDGSGPTMATLPMAPKFDPSKVITSPTRVHLNKGDQVVPLSYRPKAKIRPSAAFSLPSVDMKPRLRHSYGEVHRAA